MNRIPLVGASIVSVQLGAAIASSLFHTVGAPGTVLLRQGLAAAVMITIARPKVRGRSASDWRVVCVFGLVLAAMNVCFYEAVERLPLGIAVTIELFGPLGLAASLSRRRREFAYVLLAAVGVVNRPVFCIRSGWVLGLDVGFGFERSRASRIRRVGCRRAHCAVGGC